MAEAFHWTMPAGAVDFRFWEALMTLPLWLFTLLVVFASIGVLVAFLVCVAVIGLCFAKGIDDGVQMP